MPTFGGHSLAMLKTVHPKLQLVLNEAIKETDFIVIQGSRTREEQEADFKKGMSKAHWGQSAHDFNPSFAADCAPIPLAWSNLNSFRQMASVILRCAVCLKVPLTWGANFTNIKDFPHFELANWRALAAK